MPPTDAQRDKELELIEAAAQAWWKKLPKEERIKHALIGAGATPKIIHAFENPDSWDVILDAFSRWAREVYGGKILPDEPALGT